MKKYIHITKENREFLMKAFGVTGKTVQNAVRFDAERGDTDLAKKIRKVALERGGIVMAVAPRWRRFTMPTATCASISRTVL